ncbi:hypothetical protein [Ensifer adhaerens]|uniref:hypothetical protein n=1 Tax=Ensifer adhaerens TaxID=106592 RepID=UPI000AA38E54|nr:hypothetical protein [Ensifer adhaerens]
MLRPDRRVDFDVIAFAQFPRNAVNPDSRRSLLPLLRATMFGSMPPQAIDSLCLFRPSVFWIGSKATQNGSEYAATSDQEAGECNTTCSHGRLGGEMN